MNNNEDAHLDFLNGFLNKENTTRTPDVFLPKKKNVSVENDFLPKDEDKREISVNKSIIRNSFDDFSKYEDILIDELPMSFMYDIGTTISIRPCTVKEIQDFSTYDKNSILDFKNHLEKILEHCVIIRSSDGTFLPYQSIFEGDRIWLIYMIREKTFPNGKVLTVNVNYKNANGKEESDTIEIIRKNIEIYRNEPIMEYFDIDKKSFIFHTELRDEPFVICPPTIGLKNCFEQYIISKANNKDIKLTDSPFFKLAIYLKPNINYMSYEDLEKFHKWFEEDITIDEYSFLLDTINNHLKIGIRGLKKNKLFTPSIYPKDPSTLFIVSNAFKIFVKK